MRTAYVLALALALVACGPAPDSLADPISTDAPVLADSGKPETLARLVDTVWMSGERAFYFVGAGEDSSYRVILVDAAGAYDPALGELPIDNEGRRTGFGILAPSLPMKLVGAEDGVIGETKIGKLYVLSFFRFSTNGVEMYTTRKIDRSELTRRIVASGEGIGYTLAPVSRTDRQPYAYLAGETGNLQQLVSSDLAPLIGTDNMKYDNEWEPTRLAKPKSLDDYVAISAIQQQIADKAK